MQLVGLSPLIVCSWQTRRSRAGKPRAEQDPLARLLTEDGKDAVSYGMLREAVRTECAKLRLSVAGLILGNEAGRGLAELRFSKADLVESSITVRDKPLPLFRVRYAGWSLTLPLEYAEPLWDAARVVHLLDKAGDDVGIGQLRPEHGGDSGRFRVKL